MDNELVEFEIYQNDEMVASVSGPEDTAGNEALNYVAQYMRDGPVKLYLVTRTEIVLPERIKQLIGCT